MRAIHSPLSPFAAAILSRDPEALRSSDSISSRFFGACWIGPDQINAKFNADTDQKLGLKAKKLLRPFRR